MTIILMCWIFSTNALKRSTGAALEKLPFLFGLDEEVPNG